MKKIKLHNLIIPILSIILAVIICHYCCVTNFCSVKYNNTLDPIAILGLFATLVITIWIGSVIARRMTEQRFIKDYAFVDIRSVDDHLYNIENLLYSTQIDAVTITNLLTLLFRKIAILKHTLEISKLNQNNNVIKIDNIYLDLYAITTDSLTSTIDLNSKTSEISQLIMDMRKELRDMVYNINKV